MSRKNEYFKYSIIEKREEIGAVISRYLKFLLSYAIKKKEKYLGRFASSKPLNSKYCYILFVIMNNGRKLLSF